MKTSHRPVFDLQTGHASEFIHIARHQGQTMMIRDGSDFEVVRADDLACLLEGESDAGILVSSEVIKRQRHMLKEGCLKRFSSFFRVPITVGTCPKLSFHDRTKVDVLRLHSAYALLNDPTRIFEVMYPSAGVQEVGHHQSSRISSTPWSGRSKGSSPQSAWMRSQWPTGQPFASRSTGAGSVVCNKAATCFSSAALWSGGRLSRRWSSFMARALMPAFYEAFPLFATHQKGGAA